MDYVAYFRVSTDKQGASGLGLEAQREAVTRHVAASGGRIIAEFTEVESGKRSNRPQLERAISHAKRVKATLCVAKLDRLSRNVAFLAALMESKLPFVACDNPHATPFTLHILAAVAEHEAKAISDRTKAALAAYKARGGVLGGSRSNLSTEALDACQRGRENGSRANRDKAIREYALESRLALEWRNAGMSLSVIADRLNSEGFRTVSGADWSKVQVHRMLGRNGTRLR
jgi:DNA invertase Pin-like site-specific DNA recombinase